MTRRIGLAALTVLELPAAEQVTVAAQAGYTHVGLRLIPVAGQTLPPFDVGEVERRLADTGVRVLDLEVFRLAPETRVADFEPALAVAARLGASDLLVHGADPDEARLVENLGRLCDLAARYRLAANIEPMPWVEISSVAKARRVLDQAARANAALLVDAIHFFRAGDRFGEIPKSLNYLQLCDARAERPADMQEIIRQARSDRLFPGEGGLDLEGLMRALPPELPISVEVPYAKPMSPLERARRALAATQLLLSRVA
ncbi:MAG TPA: sugar phosphate isomerase/epimerase family protein [Burkholderiales bacterium]|nr:sugar phosphate isomerase/epimerase family protein [Burkholderiales bacterium]